MPYIKGAYSKYETAYAVALICVITSCRVGHNYRSYTCYSTKCMKFRILGIYIGTCSCKNWQYVMLPYLRMPNTKPSVALISVQLTICDCVRGNRAFGNAFNNKIWALEVISGLNWRSCVFYMIGFYKDPRV